MISWRIEIKGADQITRDIEGMDEFLKNSVHSNSMWDAVFAKISSFVEKRFDEGLGSWNPLTPKYEKWKIKAVSKGKYVNVGSFGRRICKLTDIGKLTDTMHTSATMKNEDANIFELKNLPNGVQFRYAISGNKLPYAKYFDSKRPFFFITEDEAEEVFNTMITQINLGNKL